MPVTVRSPPRTSSLALVFCLLACAVGGSSAFLLPLFAPRGASLRGTQAASLRLRMGTEGGGGLGGEDESNPFSFLNKNILFPANYQPDNIDVTSDRSDHDSQVNEDGDREVISVPINGEPVAVATIRPKMAMVYTCKVCETRQMKQFSKLAYEKGIVIIQCKGCPKKHLIADNLGWYKDWLGAGNKNIEEMLGDRGETTKRVQGKDAAMIYGEWAEESEMEDPKP